MSKSLDIEEKINILFKNYLGYPNTNINKEYYKELEVSYSNYNLGEDLLLKNIPKNPNFNIIRDNSYVKINKEDFYNYNSSTSILEDSSGVVIKIFKLKLEEVPHSNGKSFYKLDLCGNNILKDSILSNKNQYYLEGNLIKPYEFILYTSLNQRMLKGETGGDWQFDVKNGIIYFPDVSYGIDYLVDKDNPPYLTYCKYIGTKGLDKMDTRINDSLNNKAPINNPEFTGIPQAPTAALTTYNDQIATTKYVKDRFENLVNLSPGSLEALTDLSNALALDSNLSTTIISLIAQKQPIIETSTDLSFNKLELLSDLSGNDASFNNVTISNLSGITTALTAELNTSTTQIATTEFVSNALTDLSNTSIKLNQDNIVLLNDTLTKNINDLAVITMFGLINVHTSIADLSNNADNNKLELSNNINSSILDLSENYIQINRNNITDNLNSIINLQNTKQNNVISTSDISLNNLWIYGDISGSNTNTELNNLVLNGNINGKDATFIDIEASTIKLGNDDLQTTLNTLQNTKQDNIISSTDINLNNLNVSGNITASNSNLDVNTINLNGNMTGQDVSFNNMDVTNISDGISFKKLGSSIPLNSELFYENFEDSNVTGTLTGIQRVPNIGYSSNYAIEVTDSVAGHNYTISPNDLGNQTVKSVSFWHKPNRTPVETEYPPVMASHSSDNNLKYPTLAVYNNDDEYVLQGSNTRKVSKWYVNGVLLDTNIDNRRSFHQLVGQDTWYHHYIEFSFNPDSFTFLGLIPGSYDDPNYRGASILDDLRMFNSTLSEDQISDLAAGNNGNVNGGDNRTEVKLLGDMSGAYVNVNFKNVNVGSHLQSNDASFNNIETSTIKLGSNDLQTTLNNLQNSKQNNLSFGITSGDTVIMHDTASTNDYAKVSTTGLIGMTYNEVKIDLNLDNVTNESKSTMFTDPVFTGSPKLNTKELATQEYVDNKITDLSSVVTKIIKDAPEALDTLNELAAAIGDDANYAAAVTSTISNLSNRLDLSLNDLSENFIKVNSDNINNLSDRVDASLNDLSENFIKVNRDNISILQSEKQDNINNTMDISLNNLDVYGDLCGNDVSFNNIETSTINLNGFDLENTISNIKSGNIDYSSTSASDLSDISFDVNTLEHGRSLLWNSDKNIWEPGIVNQIKKQQITEVISGICNGKSIVAESGTYTLPNVTEIQEIGPHDISSSEWKLDWYNDNNIFTDINGSIINYKPPVDTKQLMYSYNFNVSEVNTQGYGGSSLWFRFFVDGQEVITQRKCVSNHIRSGLIELKYMLIIDPTLSEDDISNGLFKSWNNNKEIKIDVSVYLNKIKLYSANWNNNEDVFTRPIIEIKSVGLSTSGGSGNSDREKISTLENTISDLQNIISSLQQRLDDGGL